MYEHKTKKTTMRTKGIGPRGLGMSPLKQTDVKLKDVPGVVKDKAEEAAGKIKEGAKKLVTKIGNIKISTEEGQKRRAERKKERLKKRADKKYEKYVETFDKAKDL